jgi:hypothetical protein
MIPRLTTLDSKVKFSPDGKYLLSTGLFSLQLIRVGDTLPSLIEKDTYGSSEPKFSPAGDAICDERKMAALSAG